MKQVAKSVSCNVILDCMSVMVWEFCRPANTTQLLRTGYFTNLRFYFAHAGARDKYCQLQNSAHRRQRMYKRSYRRAFRLWKFLVKAPSRADFRLRARKQTGNKGNNILDKSMFVPYIYCMERNS